ncbi:MAG: methyltransferase domain-containing protein [Bacteroidota bacterium]|nr:methyltransferase domain-containing protein [Bacteroidota bacterium]
MADIKTKEELRTLYTEDYVSRFEKFEKSQTARIKGILKHIKFSKEDVVGDFACGNGILSRLIHQRVSACFGVDFSKEFIEIARESSKNRGISNVSFIEADIIAYSKDNTDFFDKICTLDFSEHIYDAEFISIYSAIYTALKKDGQLYLHTPNGDFIVEILKDLGIMEQFPEHIAVRNSQDYIKLLTGIGFRNMEVKFIPHYNILKYLHFFSLLPFIGKFFKARILISCSR